MNFPTSFLRRVLLVDAATSAVSGVGLLLGAGVLAGVLGLPEPLLRWTGLGFLPFAAFAAWVATRPGLWRAGAWAVIVMNVVWALDCALLLVSGWVSPAALGYAFVVAQAVFVVALAELEYVGLRREPA